METGDLVAVRGDSKLHYSRTQDGVEYGYIVDENGKQHQDRPIISLLARGYWEAPE